MRWKIFYADDTTFGNDKGEPHDAPGWGVIAIAQANDDVGVEIHSGKDFYIFGPEYGGWQTVDQFGLANYLGSPGLKTVKIGICVSSIRFREILERVRNDPDLPHKSARYEWERSHD